MRGICLALLLLLKRPVKQQYVTDSRLACVIYSRIPACETRVMDTDICVSLARVLAADRLSLLVLMVMVWRASAVDFGGLKFQPSL